MVSMHHKRRATTSGSLARDRPKSRFSRPLGASGTLDDALASPARPFVDLLGATGATVPLKPTEETGEAIVWGR